MQFLGVAFTTGGIHEFDLVVDGELFYQNKFGVVVGDVPTAPNT
jgi:hypothetical protein